MNIKQFWLEEMAYNCHQQGFVNGLSGKELLRNLMKALKERILHETQINTIEFLNKEIHNKKK